MWPVPISFRKTTKPSTKTCMYKRESTNKPKAQIWNHNSWHTPEKPWYLRQEVCDVKLIRAALSHSKIHYPSEDFPLAIFVPTKCLILTLLKLYENRNIKKWKQDCMLQQDLKILFLSMGGKHWNPSAFHAFMLPHNNLFSSAFWMSRDRRYNLCQVVTSTVLQGTCCIFKVPEKFHFPNSFRVVQRLLSRYIICYFMLYWQGLICSIRWMLL